MATVTGVFRSTKGEKGRHIDVDQEKPEDAASFSRMKQYRRDSGGRFRRP